MTSRLGIIQCIEERIKEKNKTIEQFVNEKTIEKMNLIHGLGTKGTVVYPRKNTPVTKDLHVPEMKDKFMLAENYIDKKTNKVVKITPRMSEYSYLTCSVINQPPIGWYMSEKFDGQRAIWDGAKFVSRGSPQSEPRVYPYVPIWFIALMPPGIALDGEFFIGRGKFTEATSILRTTLKEESSRKSSDNSIMDLDKRWISIKYQVFDTPNSEPFEDRQELLEKIISERTDIWKKIQLPIYLKKGKCPIVLTKQYLIKSEQQLIDYYNILVSEEAEGVMIRAPKVEYIPKRTRLILKLKPEEEAECIITSPHKEGQGQFEGLLGSFRCQLIGTDKFFYVGGMKRSIRVNYNNKSSEEYHPDGTIITFKYTEMTPEGIPRFPRYKGIRDDFNLK